MRYYGITLGPVSKAAEEAALGAAVAVSVVDWGVKVTSCKGKRI